MTDMFDGISLEHLLRKSTQNTFKSNTGDLPVRTKLYLGNCLDVLTDMESNSIHIVVTDPPYFLDGLDSDWKKGNDKSNGVVGGLPIGMKFDPQQGLRLQKFLVPINRQLYRILKPGGFMLMFSAPRLIHRMAVSVEDTGFEIRDQYVWHFEKKAQFKAFSLDHFVKKRTDINQDKKNWIVEYLAGRKTPQLRPQFESILCAQKPRNGTFIENWLEHKTGLIDAKQTLTGNAPTTVMKVEKPTKSKYNGHLTPKPVALCEHLIKLFSSDRQTVLDPFVGSGTTCVAARKTNRHSIGIDINPDYIQIAQQRIEDET